MTCSRRLRNIIIALAYNNNNNNKSIGDGNGQVCMLEATAIRERQSPHSSCFRSARPPLQKQPTHPSYIIIYTTYTIYYNISTTIQWQVLLVFCQNVAVAVYGGFLFLFLIPSHAYLLYLNTSSSRIFFFKSVSRGYSIIIIYFLCI